MLVTFSCDAHENITMFGDIAIQLLKMMGHSGTIPSAMVAADIPRALDKLKSALEKQDTHSQPYEEDESEEVLVSLKQRAWPLIELFQAAANAHCNVIWQQQ